MSFTKNKFAQRLAPILLLIGLALVSCTSWVESEIRYNSAFEAWWAQLPSQSKRAYQEDENAARLEFSEWYKNQSPDQQAKYKQIDAEREKASLLYKGQMREGVVQEQLMLP